MTDVDESLHTVHVDTPICLLDCTTAFANLSPKERMYAHYISQASFEGSLMVPLEVSPESAGIFVLLHRLFSAESLDALQQKALAAGFTPAEWRNFLMWAAFFFYNYGNYAGFGDRKFIPGVSAEKLRKLIASSAVVSLLVTYDKIERAIHCVNKKTAELGYNQVGVNTYHGETVRESDCELISRFVKEKNRELWNTRLFKEEVGGKTTLTIKSASIETGSTDEEFEGVRVRMEKGDFAPILKRVCPILEKATEYAANATQKEVLNKFVTHFTTGELSEHRDASRLWIKDANPTVESYMGFMREYRDPNGTRAEFRGFVAAVNKETSKKFAHLVQNAEIILPSYFVGTRTEFMGIVAAVNKETSKKYANLVERAESILPRLPWGRAYEKDKFLRPDFTAIDLISVGGSIIPLPWGREYEKDSFLRPDFTALDVICCGSSMIALGWIIPHMYNDIKQNEGFKNLALSNSISAWPKQDVPFVSKDDERALQEYASRSYDVQVGCHELLGHGSGKLFQRNADGSFNFDRENTVDILTGGKISLWYEPGETWESLFGHLAGGIEECRCEAVGYILCCEEDILKIFYGDAQLGQTMKYVNWLSNAHKGLMGLELYSVDNKKWGQAHSWARFILMKVVLEAGQGLLTIEETTDADGSASLSLRLDSTKIESVGVPAVREFVKKLQAYKSTADVKGATALFEKYGVNANDLKWRDIVLAKRKPRRFFVQPNTKVVGDSVELVNYPETPEGVIQSVIERFSCESIVDLERLWVADQKYFPSAYGKC